MDIADKEILYQWAQDNYSDEVKVKYYGDIDKSLHSYYSIKGKEPYLQEYTYQTLPKMKEELEKMWGKDQVMIEIITKIAVLAIKYKHRSGYVNCEGNYNSEDGVIVPYIYNF